MQKGKVSFEFCDRLVAEFEDVIERPILNGSSVYYTGVDLGTAFIVLAVLDENYKPVAGAYRNASVVKDGMVVDYLGAVKIVKELKEEIEKKLGSELIYAAAAIPPGTDKLDSGAIKNVVQAAGFELTNLLDEPTAANEVLKISDGAVVDIGGGTTGTSIIKNSEVIDVKDDPTGGTHFSLVVSGAYKKSFEEADMYKRDYKNHRELLPILKPVVERVAYIINNHIEGHDIKEISLVGGTACLTGIEEIIENYLKVKTYKPRNPLFVTPLGIALSCTQEILD